METIMKLGKVWGGRWHICTLVTIILSANLPTLYSMTAMTQWVKFEGTAPTPTFHYKLVLLIVGIVLNLQSHQRGAQKN